MPRALLAFLAIFLLTAGGGTVLLRRARPAVPMAPAPDSVARQVHAAADTTGRDTTVADSGVAVPPTATDTSGPATPLSDSLAVAFADLTGSEGADSAPEAPAVDQPASPPLDRSPTGAAASAKIFAAMDAKQAARVLELMDPADARIIIAHLAPRAAAQVLGALPPAVAADLSRAVLRPGLPPTPAAPLVDSNTPDLSLDP